MILLQQYVFSPPSQEPANVARSLRYPFIPRRSQVHPHPLPPSSRRRVPDVGGLRVSDRTTVVVPLDTLHALKDELIMVSDWMRAEGRSRTAAMLDRRIDVLSAMAEPFEVLVSGKQGGGKSAALQAEVEAAQARGQRLVEWDEVVLSGDHVRKLVGDLEDGAHVLNLVDKHAPNHVVVPVYREAFTRHAQDLRELSRPEGM